VGTKVTSSEIFWSFSLSTWAIRKPDRATLKLDRLPRLWYDIMRGLGPWFKLLAAAPDDPSLN
jgi:putative transcriptional regulator